MEKTSARPSRDRPEESGSRGLPTAASNLSLWHEALAGLDWLSLRFSPVYHGAGVPRGDGSPVIVVPGCFATDASLGELHSWLARIGYRPYYSGIGLNVRCPAASVDLLLETVDRAFEETGRKVTLVGHSLGGLLARGAAIHRPEKVARVITLGSPVSGIAAHPLVLALAELVAGDCDCGCLPTLQEPLSPSTDEVNVYTRADGVVDWRTCVRDDAMSVEVRGTHVGLICSPQAYQALARLLNSRGNAGTAGLIDRHDRPALRPAA